MNRVLAWILILGSSLSADTVEYINSSRSAQSQAAIRWRIEIPEPESITVNSEGLNFPGWSQSVLNNGLRVPVRSKLVYTRSGPPAIDLQTGAIQGMSSPAVTTPVMEQAKGLDMEVEPSAEGSAQQVQVKQVSTLGSYELWAVNVYGATYLSDTDSWSIPDGITITIPNELPPGTQLSSDELYLNNIPLGSKTSVYRNNSGLGMGRVKLFVLKDGIYRVFFDSLANMVDFPQVEIPSRSLQLSQAGQAQPIHVQDGGDGVFNAGDFFDFIGQQKYFDGSSQYYDAYSDINVYWLDWGGENGLRFVEESGALEDQNPVRPSTFWDRIHIEEDNEFERLGQVDTDRPSITRDHYFWESVNSGATKEVSFNLPDPFRGSSENLEISIGLHGLTYSETAGEEKSHTIFAFLNDNSIGEGNWVQQEEYVLTSPAALNLSHNILAVNGDNTLALFAPVSTEPGNYDKIVLNWVEIGYEHLLQANENQLRFRKSFINPSTTLEYEIQGFESHELVLYKEGLSKITGFDIREHWEASQAQYSLVFQDHCTDATPDYWAASVEGLLHPVRATMDTLANLRSQDGDLIVITIPQFMPYLERYLEFKRDEGWNPVAVSVADIYDEFNWGVHSPEAIKAFLKYAHSEWPSQPEYGVFFGDARSDPQQSKRDTRIQNIPTFYMQTYGWGAAEADYWYSLLLGDDYIPDMHIGRIPINDLEDLETSLTKLISYGEGGNYGSWQNELITIAGFDATFKSQSQSLLRNTVPQAYMPSRIFIDRDSEGQIFWGDTDSLIAHWNRGKLLINFLGHGGGAVWADRSLFVRDDINYLDPETPPAFVTSMTCFTASFAQTRGLGEVVLAESPTGAIGWFGSSGVGWIINDYLMIQPLLRRLLTDDKPVGEIIDLARMEYFLANSGYDYLKPSMLFQYNYLGDPSTRLLRPEPMNQLSSAKVIYQPDEQVLLNFEGNESATLKVLPINSVNQPWWSLPQVYEVNAGSQLIINQENGALPGVNRAIYTIDRGQSLSAGQGHVSYSIEADWFEHEEPTAEAIATSQSLPLRVRYHTEDQVPDSMVLVLTGSNQAQIAMLSEGEWWFTPDSIRFSAGRYITQYHFAAYFQESLVQTSSTYTLYLPRDIALTISDLSSGVKGKQSGLYIDYSLLGASSAHSELILETGLHASSRTVSLQEGVHKLFIPMFFADSSIQISATLHLPEDIDTTDNRITQVLEPEYYQLIPGLGLTFDGLTSDSLRLWTAGSIHATTTDTAWLKFQPYHDPVVGLPGVTLYQDSTIYTLEASSPEVGVVVRSERQLFSQAKDLNAWAYLAASSMEPELQTVLSAFHRGILLAMGQKQNFTGPDVSMMVEGQLFFDGDYLLSNSYLNLLGEDENGFTWNENSISVSLDGSEVEVEFGDTTSSGQIISAVVPLELEVGEHTIKYQLMDALGNWSEAVEVTGVVSRGAHIHDYGNYPNPFEGETLIIYELTQPLDEVVIDIFTLSGFKLHSINTYNARVSIDLGAIGYHEVPWNGRDRNDDFVANGVYFYRVKGFVGDQEVSGSIGKMVKNR